MILMYVVVFFGFLLGSVYIYIKNVPKCNNERISETLKRLAKKESLMKEKMLKVKVGSIQGIYSIPEPMTEDDDFIYKEERICKAKFYIQNAKGKKKEKIMFNESTISLKSVWPRFNDLKNKKFHNFIIEDQNIFDNFASE